MNETRDLAKIAESPRSVSNITKNLDKISQKIKDNCDKEKWDTSEAVNDVRDEFFEIQKNLDEWLKIAQWLLTDDFLDLPFRNPFTYAQELALKSAFEKWFALEENEAENNKNLFLEGPHLIYPVPVKRPKPESNCAKYNLKPMVLKLALATRRIFLLIARRKKRTRMEMLHPY